MVTTRRSVNMESSFEQGVSMSGGVAVLERPMAQEEKVAPVQAVDTAQFDEVQNRRRNLEKLLNYDRYAEVQASATQEEAVAPVKEEAVASVENVVEQQIPVAISDEDIKPTSTTMQFGEDIDNIREEMNAKRAENKEKLALNGKGKLVLVLYSLVVAVVFALIVINTGVLAKLNDAQTAKVAELNQTVQEYEAIVSEIESISSSEHIANVAENELGMVKGN